MRNFNTLRSESPQSSDTARTVQFYGLLFPESRMNANIFFSHSILMTKNVIYHFQSFSNFLTFDFFTEVVHIKSNLPTITGKSRFFELIVEGSKLWFELL